VSEREGGREENREERSRKHFPVLVWLLGFTCFLSFYAQSLALPIRTFSRKKHKKHQKNMKKGDGSGWGGFPFYVFF
jgi:hypothetical protein